MGVKKDDTVNGKFVFNPSVDKRGIPGGNRPFTDDPPFPAATSFFGHR